MRYLALIVVAAGLAFGRPHRYDWSVAGDCRQTEKLPLAG
jgi:hypothetical protein